MQDFRHLYSQFNSYHPEKSFFTAHSHHFWPDVTRQAQLQYWDDSARMVDHKWEYVFGEVVPAVQRIISGLIHFDKFDNIAFAPNTHELVFRLISSLFENEKIKIVCSDSEFYSFDRQVKRLAEWNKVEVETISNKSLLEGNLQEFISQLKKAQGDILFLSQVFFNSGYYLPLDEIEDIISNFDGIVVIDGYHSFGALPINISRYQHKIFFTAGGYKYAQGGEGICFLTIPDKCQLRPMNTGWFAAINALSSSNNANEVPYPLSGGRFAGSTQDYSAFYRFKATWDLFNKEGITIEVIHKHIANLQQIFLQLLGQSHCPVLRDTHLLNHDSAHRGHFLAYQFESEKDCEAASARLSKTNIETDRRGSVLRFGFGLNHTEECVQKLVTRITKA